MFENKSQEQYLAKFITPEEANSIARETGFVQRSGGKINPYDFLIAMIFRLSTSVPPALKLIGSFLNFDISSSGIHQRFSSKATSFFKSCLQLIIMKQLAFGECISTELLDPFNRVLIIDSSGWGLSKQLQDVFCGSGGSGSDASCKIQFCYGYKTGSILLVDDTKGTMPDQKYSKNIGAIVEAGDLLLMDLGYWSFTTLHEIDTKKGYFILRFNSIVNLYQDKNGELLKLELPHILKKQEESSIEFDAVIKGNKKNEHINIRVVAFRAPEEVVNLRRKKLKANAKKKGRTPTKKSLELCAWSIFCTNAPAKLVPSNMIRSMYRIRWNIELIFKSWKSILRVHRSNVRKNHDRVKCELYAKIIYAVIVHSIHHKLQYYAWTKKRKEISLDCLWKFIITRSESIHNAMKSSIKDFSKLINSLFPLLMKTCEKKHQPSRKTTLQLINEMIGDDEPIKISCISNGYTT
ncbi:IS4 family transposase [Desulfobacterales bacterium HSG16]|nr:IS4 family transposase [Desulfobacterales bacterium HSG16]